MNSARHYGCRADDIHHRGIDVVLDFGRRTERAEVEQRIDCVAAADQPSLCRVAEQREQRGCNACHGSYKRPPDIHRVCSPPLSPGASSTPPASATQPTVTLHHSGRQRITTFACGGRFAPTASQGHTTNEVALSVLHSAGLTIC